MKKTALLCTLILFVFLFARAQEFKWNPSLTIKKGTFQYCLGVDENTTFTLGSDEDLTSSYYNGAPAIFLYKYNSLFEEPEAIKIKLKGFVKFIGGFISDDKKLYIIYVGGNSLNLTVSADVFGTDGSLQENIDMFSNKTNPGHKMGLPWSIVSDDKKWYLIGLNNTYKLYNSKIKMVWEKEFSKKTDKVLVLNDGNVLLTAFADSKENTESFYKIDTKNKWTELKQKGLVQFQFDAVSRNIYLVTPNVGSDRSFSEIEISTGFSYTAYSIADMKKVTEKNDIPFDAKIIEKSTDSKKHPGIAGLTLQAASSDNEGPIFVFTTKYFVHSTSGAYLENANILLVKMHDDKQTEQKLIKAKDDQLNGVGSIKTLFSGDKLIILCFPNASKWQILMYAGQINLKTSKKTDILDDDHASLKLDINNPFLLSDGSYLIMSSDYKKYGSVVIKP